MTFDGGLLRIHEGKQEAVTDWLKSRLLQSETLAKSLMSQQTVCSCQMLFYARLLPSPFSISLRSHKLRQCKRKHNFSIPLYCICECFTITWLCHVGGLIRLGGSAIPGGPKKRNPGFDFVITSANVHRF